jgi:Tol biopolymer transport system component
MRRAGFLLLLGVIAGGVQGAGKHRVLFNRFLVPDLALFIADADGKNERALVPHQEIEYSPNVSLDGKWVAFTSERSGLADIYRVHPDGSGLQQLTNDPAFDDQGALSPDNATLAFVSTRGGGTTNIWLLDIATNKYRNLTNNRSGNYRPSWSPDGQWIAFSSDRDANAGAFPGSWEHLQSLGVYVVHPDGTGLKRLTRAGGVAGSPSWSADGKRVLYYETDEVGAYLAKRAASRTEIVSVELATGERRQYTASNETKLSPQSLPGGKISYVVRATDDNQGLKVWYPDRRIDTIAKGAVRHPSWFADGKQVVYERALHPAATEHLVPTASRDPEFELVLSEPFPSFSPDGTKLIYSQYGNHGTDTRDTSIEMMNADGSEEHTLFHREGVSAFDAVWSPAGDMIAFCVGKYFRAPGFPASQVALMKPDGWGFRIIADDGVNNGFPSWSPDGKRIVYKRGRQLVILSLADGKVTPLTDEAHWYNFPQWSPKGDVIMFTSDRDGDFELYTIRPDGSGTRRLTNTPGNDAHSIWSADGEWIVFSSARMGFKDEMALYDGVPQPYGEIFAMRADGSDVRQLTDNKWEDASPGWAPDVKAIERTAEARRK